MPQNDRTFEFGRNWFRTFSPTPSSVPLPLPLQVESAKTGCQGPHPAGLWIAPQTETPQPIRKSLTVLDDFQNKPKKKCSLFSEFHVFSFCYFLLSCCWALLGQVWLPPLHILSWCIYRNTFGKELLSLPKLSTQRLKFQLSQDVIVQKWFQSLNNLLSFNILQLWTSHKSGLSLWENNDKCISDAPRFCTVTWNFLMKNCKNEKKRAQINKYLR